MLFASSRGRGRAGLRLDAGLELLGDPALERCQPVHATHAELVSRASDAGGARARKRAIALTANAIERAKPERACAHCADEFSEDCPNRLPGGDVLSEASRSGGDFDTEKTSWPIRSTHNPRHSSWIRRCW
jgi:hypothetical protein